MLRTAIALALAPILGCAAIDLAPPPDVIHARFDPDARVIPMPTDVLRDAARNRLAIPLDEPLTPAERALYTFLNTLDGWSSASAATVKFTGAIDPATLTSRTVEVWHWRETPRRVHEVTLSLDAPGTTLTVAPPETGWERGGTYVVLLRGGDLGPRGRRGERLECDAAFYFLRLEERLDTPEHERAFPGATAAERRENAARLEEIRRELSPFFDFFAGRGVPRREVAALWSFTVTERVELAMDKLSQRMPLPIDLLLDPATGRVELPPAPWDSELVVEAKERLGDYDGFAISGSLLFGFTGPIDPGSVSSETVRLYRLDDPLTEVPASVRVLGDHLHVEVTPEPPLLEERTRYGLAVSGAVRDADGWPVVRMPAGELLRLEVPVAEGGHSLVDPVEDADAVRLEEVRRRTAPLYDALGRGALLAAWSFTTMSVLEPMKAYLRAPEAFDVPPDPVGVTRMSPLEALADFPLAIASLVFVGDVYHGAIRSPVFLDRETRAFRGDGGHAVEEIRFTLTVPRGAEPGRAIPVVVFGHAILTERRFVLAVADALAARGFAAISIDFPFHGERTHCYFEGPLSIPDPRTGALFPLTRPCEDGGTCAADGRCRDQAGADVGFRRWPILGSYQASGAAFIEIGHIARTRDHFRQAVIDLTALSRSLRRGDWQAAIGVPLATDELYFAGQSLGGIIGSSFVALSPEVTRAVINVAGADTVGMFADSPFFGLQVDAFFTREGVEKESFEGRRFLNVARWFMDAVDPQSFATRLTEDREVMLQMATLDFVIPNAYTRKLQALSGAPRRDYLAEHGFLAIPIEPEYFRGVHELSGFLAEEFAP